MEQHLDDELAIERHFNQITNCLSVERGCCDHVAAAGAGHLNCLEELCQMGNFLPLGSPDWAAAGEARKFQVFEAALAACSNGQAHVLSWLFSSGWPSPIETVFTWLVQDLWEPPPDFASAFPWLQEDFEPCLLRVEGDVEPFWLEVRLCRCAVQQEKTCCLEALLDAGCRSKWICRVAAVEGKADFLALAARRGCPCDLWVWRYAASTGKHAVLELLTDAEMRSIAKKGFIADCLSHGRCRTWMEVLTGDAAVDGQWECLEILKRAGCTDWSMAAISAAWGGQLEILQNLIDLDPGVLQFRLLQVPIFECFNLDSLSFLAQAGCPWNSQEAVSPESYRSPEALRTRLQQIFDGLDCWDWKWCLIRAMEKGPDCMQACYVHYGYQWSHDDGNCHPATWVIKGRQLACLRLAVQLSGPPNWEIRDFRKAAEAGEEMPKEVHRMVGGTIVMDSEVAERAARAGHHGALRYALENSAPLSANTFVAAIKAGSWECLKCAYEHALVAGLPADYDQSPGDLLLDQEDPYHFLRFGSVVPSLQVLRYVCEVMQLPWPKMCWPEQRTSSLL
eukprot:jgi/Botrbrau1/1557/Bobra.0107s0045.1